MLSRIADSLYWMSRYLERVDNTARLIEINLLHLLEAGDAAGEAAPWHPLLSISGNEAAYAARNSDGITGQRVIEFMVRERANSNAIRSCLRLARDNARVVRDRISKEMWEAMNELWLRAEPALTSPMSPEQTAPFCRFVRGEVARFHGVTVSTMMRGEAFGFYHLGTFVERADMTARILDVKYHLLLPAVSLIGSALDYYQWAALLKSLSGFEAYRRAHQTGLRPLDVAQFVVQDGDFPRSLRFSLDRIEQALESIGWPRSGSVTAAAVEGLRSALARPAASVFADGLHEFLSDFTDRIAALDLALHDEYLEAVVVGEAPCAT